MKSSLRVLSILFVAGASAVFADDPPIQSKPLTLRFYPVSQFVQPPTSTATGICSFHLTPHTSGAVGGGGFGGGGQGGGGFFSVPTTPTTAPITSAIATHFGGGDQFASETVNQDLVSNVHNSDVTFHGLINLIVMHIAPDSWQLNGGDATITAVNETLLIQQNEENHAKVTDFLKQLQQHTIGAQTLTIELWWLPLDLEQQQALAVQIKQTEASTSLDELCNSVGGYHGELKTRNRITGALSSGYNTPVIAGQVPVVGNGASGLQPIMTQLQIGLTAEVTPRIQLKSEGQGVQLAVQTEKTALRNLETTETTGGNIDRYQLGRHSLSASCTCQFGIPTIIGSLSAVGLSDESGDHSTELILVVKVDQ